jgi:hypothetical protein
MLWPVLALAVALLVPLVTRGSYGRLLDKPWRWTGFLLAGLGLQVALDFLPIPESHWHSIGFGLLVMSYVLLLAFCARNVLIRGLSVVFVGIALNAIAITVNQGMPVKVPPDWARTGRIEATIKHHPREAGDRLLVLTDIIVLRSPFNTVLSFGDLILAVGLCDVTFHASRSSRRRRRRATPERTPRTRPTQRPERLVPALRQARPVPRSVPERTPPPVVDVRRPRPVPRAAPAPHVQPAVLPPEEDERVDRLVRVFRV